MYVRAIESLQSVSAARFAFVHADIMSERFALDALHPR